MKKVIKNTVLTYSRSINLDAHRVQRLRTVYSDLLLILSRENKRLNKNPLLISSRNKRVKKDDECGAARSARVVSSVLELNVDAGVVSPDSSRRFVSLWVEPLDRVHHVVAEDCVQL